MTANDLYKAFLLELDSYLQGRVLLSSEVEHFLNLAQDQIVREMAPMAATNAQIADELRPLTLEAKQLTVVQASTITGGSPFEWNVTVPANLAYLLYMEAGLTRSASPVIVTKEYHPCREITISEIAVYRVTSFHKPFLRYPGLLRSADGFLIFADDVTTVVDARARYIRYPLPITLGSSGQTSELSTYLHNTLVNRATSLFLNEQPRASNSGN